MSTTPARLAALRQELARRGLAGFVVPRADEHQGEYVPASAQRLAWISGFTGSAGVAVVLADRAALFVDGRYTLQAEREADPSLFELVHMVERPPARWVDQVLARGDRLGYDPWLHTGDQVTALRAACERVGAVLAPCADNPLDAVWIDRPPPPTAPLAVHPQALAGRNVAEKRADIAAALAAERLDAAVLSDPASVAWLLNLRGGDVEYAPLPLAFAIVHADGAVDLFVDPRKVTPAVAAHLEAEARRHPPAALPAALDGLGGRRVRMDSAQAPVAISDRLQLAGATVENGADPCALPKACKNAAELAGARAAHRRDGAALCRFLAWLAREAPAGTLDEIAAADRLEAFRRQGELFCEPSFPTIAGAGANGAIVHYRATPDTCAPLQPGRLFLLDSGGQYLDGTTDVTRTVAIGPAGADERRHFTLVLRGHVALASAVFPAGTTGSQLDVLARLPLWQAGLDYDHGTGHGVGSFLSVHEGPQRISKAGSTVALQPGMILSVEPGYYRAGAYGIRLENLVAVAEAEAPPGAERPLLRFEPLTLAPFDRSLVDVAQLTAEERAWLDAYHARVAAEIAPLVDEPTRAWLAVATAPLDGG